MIRAPMDTKDATGRRAAQAGAGMRRPGLRTMALRLTLGAGVPALAVLIILLTLFTPSPHLAHGIRPAFAFTVFSALVLLAAAFAASLALSRPDFSLRAVFVWLPAALILAIGVAAELAFAPPQTWFARMVGGNPFACFASVFLLALPVLIGALWALRHSAPEHPRVAGACAGLLAGAVSAALFLAHCPENSLLYTLAWHVPAIVLVAALGVLAGERLLRR
jgi:hypothetical protein